VQKFDMNSLKININESGQITEIGFVETYQHECPSFINADNAWLWTCENLANMSSVESWTFNGDFEVE